MAIKPRIGIDVDETIVDTKSVWKQWCLDNYGIDLKYTKEITDPKLLEFWKQPDLYKELEPIPEAKETIDFLYNSYEIIFLSHCFPEHLESKIDFLSKFKYHQFIDTFDKYKVPLDYIIDDRDIFFEPIKQQNLSTVCILLKTEYLDRNIADYKFSNWNEIKQFFKKN